MRAVDARADVFSLGCVLFKCLTGRAPFVGGDPSGGAGQGGPRDRAAPAASCAPDIPEPLDALVARCSPRPRKSAPPMRPRLTEALALVPRGLGSGPGGREQRRGGDHRDGAAGRLRGAGAAARRGAGLRGAARRGAYARRAARGRPGSELARDRGSLGGALDVLADGSILVSIAGGGVATDQAARAARCAVALRGMLGASAAMALLRRPAHVGGRRADRGGDRARRRLAGAIERPADPASTR